MRSHKGCVLPGTIAVKSYPFVYQDQRPAEVAILLGLCNGAQYLRAQLASLAAQSHGAWSLLVSDDGKDDGSVGIIRDFALGHPARSIRIVAGPQAGFSSNLLGLLERCAVKAPFAAFCDQDDVWLPGKLTRAIAALAPVGDAPALYCGRTFITDAGLRINGLSPRFGRPPGFANALVQSIAGGNTMVLNRAAIVLLRRAAAGVGPVPSHDWWAYQIVTGAGGRVIYDAMPMVLYRQHAGNLVGANTGCGARAARLRRLLSGDMARWSDQNIAALHHAWPLLTPQAQGDLAGFAQIRKRPVLTRLGRLAGSGLYRQTGAGTGALWLASALGRL
ncbi:MAG: glycosyltransferase [Alphaproteobacteria bacterium]|nr:glycosyltransferase [Alphaproteobacteria bacterium]